MITLGVDTSTNCLRVSVVNKKKILATYNSERSFKHSDLLVPTIKKALRKTGTKIDEIDLFSIGMGPGSFTGLRVGVTTLRALAIAVQRPIVGIPSLDAIAYNGLTYLKKKKLLSKYGKICPLLDAKKKQVYACIYRVSGVNIVRETDYFLGPLELLIKRLKGKVLFLGDAISLYEKELLKKKGLKAHFAKDKIWLPKASTIARMGIEKYEDQGGEDPYDLEPLYLYARDCNVRYEKHKKEKKR